MADGVPRALVVVAALFAVAALRPASSDAGEARLDGVSPAHAPAAAGIRLRIAGEGFGPGMRAALLGGGSSLLATYAVPEGARGLEEENGRACVTFYSHAAKLGGIQILDLSNSSGPVRLGAFETGDSGLDVQQAGDLAFFTFMNPYTFLGGLHIVDVSRPDAPHRVGTFDTFFDPHRLVLDGRYVYVAAGSEGLKIIDTLDPTQPVLAGEATTPGSAMDIKVQGGLAYVADSETLLVFDVSDPRRPLLVDTFPREPSNLGGPADPSPDARRNLVGVTIAGSRLLAVDRLGALLVFDISNSSHPALQAQVPIADAAEGVAVDGRLAYVAAGYSGLQIVDLDRKGGPGVVGSLGLFGNSAYFTGVVIADGRAYVTDLINGVHVIDVATPAGPDLVGSLDLMTQLPAAGSPGVAVAGRTAFVADAEAGMLAVDVTNPAAPTLRASLGLTGPAAGLATGSGASEGLVFLANGVDGVRVVDARVPGRLAVAGESDTAGEALGIAIAGSLLYVADGSRGLAILDAAEPLSPRPLGSIDTPGRALAVAVDGPLAYVADDSRGLRIFDVGHPESPALVGTVDTPGRAVGVAVASGRAYVADLNRGVQIVDVTHPEAPSIIANIGTPGAAGAVLIDGDRLYVADGFSGVLEFDVRNAADPFPTGVYDTPGIATGLVLSRSLLYVSDRTGLRIARPNPALPAPSFLSPEALLLDLPAGFGQGSYDLTLRGAGFGATLENALTLHGVAAPGSARERRQP